MTEPSPRSIPAASETVLVVEDEPALRELVREVLEDAGYTVLAAQSPEEALATSASHPGTIDLLLTDMALPKMGGAALATRLQADRPLVGVLFMSGNLDQAIPTHGAPHAGTPFVQKPFTPDALLRQVRSVLDGLKEPRFRGND